MLHKISFFLIAALLGSCLALGTGSAVLAEPRGGDHVVVVADDYIKVHPLPSSDNGKSPADVKNIQWALDNVASGGTVELLSRDVNGEANSFYFKSDAFVMIAKPVTFIGDGELQTAMSPDGAIDVPLTTISGGYRSVRVKTSGQVVIDGITFKNWDSSAINVIESDDLFIQNNYITSPFFNVPSDITQGGPTIQSIIVDEGRTLPGSPIGSVTGNLAVKDNVIDLEQHFGPFVCIGISFCNADSECDITGNQIYNTASIGIRVWDSSRPASDPRTYTYLVEENTIKPGTVGVPYRPDILPAACPVFLVNGAGAVAKYYADWGHPIPSPPILDKDSDATFKVYNNIIEVAHKYAWGIHLANINYFNQPAHLVEQNEVTYSQPITYDDLAVPLYLACGNTEVSDNTVICEPGVELRRAMEVSCVFVKRGFKDNTFSGNDLSDMTLASDGYHVYLPAGLQIGTAINTTVLGTILPGGVSLKVGDVDEYDPIYGLASDYTGVIPSYFERDWTVFGNIPDTGIWFSPFPKPPVRKVSGNPIAHPKNNSY